ncbi:MAG: T9SS type A sorting domain-containing protein [Bacteroidetes bacterium]|nr:T9SS type A sorting domain-containing protein [Bacteroidota bacterium]
MAILARAESLLSILTFAKITRNLHFAMKGSHKISRHIVVPEKLLALLSFVLFFGIQMQGNGQPTNLIRNHSFENGDNNYLRHTSELDAHCARWRQYKQTTTDWFYNAPGFVHGALGCFAGENVWNNLPAIPNGDGPHYAGVVKFTPPRGEGLQQKMAHKLRHRTYHFSFDYFIPCDTNPYVFDLYFGTGINDTSYHVIHDTLDRQLMGQWHTYDYTFTVPPPYSNRFDWFVWLFDGYYDTIVRTGGNASSYLFVDNFHVDEFPVTCSSCDPNGLISWNNNSARPYMTPDGDGIFDEWVLSNINNVSWYTMEVIDRWQHTVYTDVQQNVNGFEDLSLRWDNRNDAAQFLNVPNYYQIVVTLGNCGTQISQRYDLFTLYDHAYDTFSIAPNYVPPLFGLEPSPTHYQILHLYGGPYYGTHDWYACDSIIIGSDEAIRVPYFWAASTSNLGFHFTNGFDTRPDTDFRIDSGADVDIVPEPVACCPQLRLANPELPNLHSGDLDALTQESLGIDPDNTETLPSIKQEVHDDAFQLAVYPNPADDVVHINIHLADAEIVKTTLLNAAGIELLRILDGVACPKGDHSISVSSVSLPDGLYFVQVQHKAATVTKKLVIQH